MEFWRHKKARLQLKMNNEKLKKYILQNNFPMWCEVVCKVIHIHDFLNLKSGSTVKESMGSLRQEYVDENVHVRNMNRTNIIEGLELYIKLNQPDVLSLAIDEKLMFEKIFEPSVTKYFVQNPQLPILTFRK